MGLFFFPEETYAWNTLKGTWTLICSRISLMFFDKLHGTLLFQFFCKYMPLSELGIGYAHDANFLLLRIPVRVCYLAILLCYKAFHEKLRKGLSPQRCRYIIMEILWYSGKTASWDFLSIGKNITWFTKENRWIGVYAITISGILH